MSLTIPKHDDSLSVDKMKSFFICSSCNCVIKDNPYIFPCGDLYCKSCCSGSKIICENNDNDDNKDNSEVYECKTCNVQFPCSPNICIILQQFLVDLYENNKPNEEILTCCICLDLLWKPTVLLCGHCICFWCMERSTYSKDSCPLCRHDNKYRPKVSHTFHNFILEFFPHNKERGEDSDLVVLEESVTKLADPSQRTERGLLLRLMNTIVNNLQCNDFKEYCWNYLGCDGCGCCPIIGEHVYCCKNCLELVGFDLCENCFKNHKLSNSNIIGRYDQVHDPSTHEFVTITPHMVIDLFSEQYPQYISIIERIGNPNVNIETEL